MSYSGFDYIPGAQIITPFSKSGSSLKSNTTNKESKYLQVTNPGEYLVRLVSGFVPFMSHYIPDQGYKICPSSLLLQRKVIVSDGSGNSTPHIEMIHLKENGQPYTMAEAFCPMCSENISPQTRYATNVIDRDEQQKNPNGPIPIKILTGPWDLFKGFIEFQSKYNPYSPADPTNGPNFLIKTNKTEGANGRTKITYLVTSLGPSILTQNEDMATKQYKNQNNDTGIWDLVSEYHPYKCSLKMAVDNGVNPKFSEKKSPYKNINAAPSQQQVQATQPQQPQYVPQNPVPQQPIQQPVVTQQQPMQQQQYVQQPQQPMQQAQYAQQQQQATQQQVTQQQVQQQPTMQAQQAQYIQQPQQIAQPQYVQQPQQQQQQQAFPSTMMETQIKQTQINEITTDDILSQLSQL